MPDIRELTVECLSHLTAGGQTTLPVDDDARAILRGWMLHARGARGASSASAVSPVPAPTPVREKSPAPVVPAPVQGGGEMSVEEKLALLREKTLQRKQLHALGLVRPKMIFSSGDPHARLMLLGDAPGYEDEEQGAPFCGMQGQLLDKILAAMGLSREQVYLSYVCKFSTCMETEQGFVNRVLSKEEIEACRPLIEAEVRAIRPACVVCFGNVAASALMHLSNALSSRRGKWVECQGVPVRVTYHLNHLLRHEGPQARRFVWEDMLAAMELLGMPISQRQQRYFLPS